MVRVLLDACVPARLRSGRSEFQVETSHHAGLDQLLDGALLDAIVGRYEVLVTRDRNLQQRIGGRSLAIIVIRTLDQSPEAFDALLPELRQAISAAVSGTVTLVGGNVS